MHQPDHGELGHVRPDADDAEMTAGRRAKGRCVRGPTTGGHEMDSQFREMKIKFADGSTVNPGKGMGRSHLTASMVDRG